MFLLIKWDRIAKIKGSTLVIISMNAFLLMTILALYIVLKPDDSLMVEQFQSNIRKVYLISFFVGNTILIYFYKRDLDEIHAERELKNKIKEEKKRLKKEKETQKRIEKGK